MANAGKRRLRLLTRTSPELYLAESRLIHIRLLGTGRIIGGVPLIASNALPTQSDTAHSSAGTSGRSADPAEQLANVVALPVIQPAGW